MGQHRLLLPFSQIVTSAEVHSDATLTPYTFNCNLVLEFHACPSPLTSVAVLTNNHNHVLRIQVIICAGRCEAGTAYDFQALPTYPPYSPALHFQPHPPLATSETAWQRGGCTAWSCKGSSA